MNKFNKFNLDCKKKNNFLPKYNYLKKIFEHDIRLCNTGNEKFADQNFQKSIKRIFLFSCLIKKFFYFFIIILSFFNNKNKIFLRSKTLSKKSNYEIKKELNIRGFDTYGLTNMGNNFLDYIFLLTFIYDFLERTSDTIKILKKFKCYTISDFTILQKQEKFNKSLDLAFKKEVAFIKKVLKKLKIKGLLLHTDQTIFSGIIIQAAKQLKIKTAVIAHGMFTNPKLVGVLPVNADKLFIWSKKLTLILNQILKKKKAIFIDGIKSNLIYVHKKRNNVVYAGSPFYLLKKQKVDKIFFKTLELIKKKYYREKAIFCAHPLEDCSLFKLRIEKIGFFFSKKNTYKELKKAKVVFGDYSSILFESLNNGIKSYQIKEIVRNPEYFLENVPRISCVDIKNIDQGQNPTDVNTKKIEAYKIADFFKKIKKRY